MLAEDKYVGYGRKVHKMGQGWVCRVELKINKTLCRPLAIELATPVRKWPPPLGIIKYLPGYFARGKVEMHRLNEGLVVSVSPSVKRAAVTLDG